jgi:hypothetical protein
MDAAKPNPAWQALTPAGVAAFAAAPWRRLLLVQGLVALAVGLAAAWFCYDAYVPVVSKAIHQLPEQGEIRGRQLDWRGDSPVLLAENRFLALNVDLADSREIRSVAHVQIELGRSQFKVHSLFGHLTGAYPAGWVLAMNRTELAPLWGAWRPVLLVGVVVFGGAGLMASWFLLGLIYAGPVRFYAAVLQRQLSWWQAWKLSGAALLPGALLLVLALSCYDLGVMDLVQLVFVYLAHVVVGWVYLLISPLVLARRAVGEKSGNPFAGGRPQN